MSRTITVASADFDSARRLDTLHGHGFRASVAAALPAGFAEFPGSELHTLGAALQAAVAPLRHTMLNDHIAEPGDPRIASWLRERLGSLPGLAGVAVQSSRGQGAVLDAAGAPLAWRRYRFQSAHRLPNVPLGHKCGRMHGHAFEAVLHARDADHAALDAAWAPLHMQLNYHCLNEIAGLANPTSEVLSSWLWPQLKPHLPGLVSVSVYETASCGARFDGQTHRIWKELTLDSAVRLHHAPIGHALHGVHGQTYTLRLHLGGPLDPQMGWTVDFGDVKDLFKPVFRAVDHQPLYEIGDLADGDSASLAAWLLAKAAPRLPALQRVDLFEAPGQGSLVGASADAALLNL